MLTDAGRRSRQPVLFYLFAEPRERAGRPISPEVLERHREEVQRFSDAVEGDAVPFAAASYREWLASWSAADDEVSAHAQRILAAFQP